MIVAAAIVWSVGSSLWYFPHSFAYCNELVGGPKNGHNYLLDSNVAWGQDLFFLKGWLQKHPEASPLRFASYGYIDPRLAGIDFSLPPAGPKVGRQEFGDVAGEIGPLPGWYAIDVNHLHGTRYSIPNGKGGWEMPTPEKLDYSYFLRFEPIDTAGYSVFIYHITPDDANRVRRELGLPELHNTRSLVSQ